MAKIDWPRTGGVWRVSVRGVLNCYLDPRRGYIARAWPRKRGRTNLKPSVVYQSSLYGERQRQSTTPNFLDYETCLNWSKFLPMTWRDIYSQLIIGQFMTLQNLDGTIWQRQLCMSDNPQYLLDLIDNTPGALLFRDTTGWQGLAPGTDGYILTMHGGVPLWLPQGQGSLQTWLEPAMMGTGLSASVSAGNIVANTVRPWGNFQANKMVVNCTAAVATAHVTPAIYADNAGKPAGLVASGATVTGVGAGRNVLPLSATFSMTAGTYYWAALLVRIAAVQIMGKASSAIATLAYNTNDTPPSSMSTATATFTNYGGMYLET